jgi:hypothetical protein
MDGAGGEPSVRRIGGRATQEQLPSVSDAAIYNSLILNQKIAALRLLPLSRSIFSRNDRQEQINQRLLKLRSG